MPEAHRNRKKQGGGGKVCSKIIACIRPQLKVMHPSIDLNSSVVSPQSGGVHRFHSIVCSLEEALRVLPPCTFVLRKMAHHRIQSFANCLDSFKNDLCTPRNMNHGGHNGERENTKVLLGLTACGFYAVVKKSE